jgi:cellulose synthase/poly-beta-1,6-N-acetylglucosamine synthase-like glycosyltransferase
MDIIPALTLGLLVLLYFWTAYNIPIIAIGVRHMLRSNSKKKEEAEKKNVSLPTMSIVVPVKDEERVIERLLEALIRLDYPPQKKEIIIVEDASKDRTPEICRSYAERYPGAIKFFHREISRGKPSALNYGFKKAKGEIVAVFDADNVPEPDTLRKATKYFEDPSVAAVQGSTCIINAEENMITKIVSYEEAVWLKNYLQGKDVLKLFVPLTGSCQFIRRDIAEEVGLWDESCLAEDLEMSARITERGYSIRFAPDLISWQEAPSKLSHLIKQRIRWYRGYMEVAVKYGRFLKNLEKKTFDAEVTLMVPYVLAAFFLSSIMSLYFSVFPIYDSCLLVMTNVTFLLTTFTLLTAGIALIYATKPMRVKNILWLPFVYVYWSLQCVLTAYAFLQVIFRRPRRWMKTEKTGRCTRDVV